MARHRLLVSGAGGFVGSTLAAMVQSHPLADAIEFAGLKDDNGGPVDIRDQAAVEQAVIAFQPTAIIHLAAIASPREARQDPHEAWMVNLMGTFHLADALMRHVPEARFVFAGSAEVYGQSFIGAKASLDENAPLAPVSSYGATKAAADLQLGQMALDGLKATRFRPFNHTGPGQAPHYVVPSFARQIARIEKGAQEPVIRVGNLKSKRDFMDVRDVARAYLETALAPADTDMTGAFNLSTGAPLAIETLLETLLKLSSTTIQVEVDPKLVRSDEIETVSGNPANVTGRLGWSASMPIERTLGDVLAYWRAQDD